MFVLIKAALRRVRVTTVVVENNTYYIFWVFVFVSLVIPHAMRMRRIVICNLSGSTIFLHIVPYTGRFSRGGELLNIKCVLISSTNSACKISHY